MSNLVASVDQAASTGVLAAPAGDARIAMVDPADIGEVAAVLLTSPDHAGRVYAVTGGTAVTYHEVAAAFSSALGRRITFADVPDDAAMRALLDSGAPEWLASDLVTLFGKLRAGACATATDSVRELTGRPARTLADWAREHLTSSAVPALADAANAVGPTQLP